MSTHYKKMGTRAKKTGDTNIKNRGHEIIVKILKSVVAQRFLGFSKFPVSNCK